MKIAVSQLWKTPKRSPEFSCPLIKYLGTSLVQLYTTVRQAIESCHNSETCLSERKKVPSSLLFQITDWHWHLVCVKLLPQRTVPFYTNSTMAQGLHILAHSYGQVSFAFQSSQYGPCVLDVCIIRERAIETRQVHQHITEELSHFWAFRNEKKNKSPKFLAPATPMLSSCNHDSSSLSFWNASRFRQNTLNS